MLHLLICLVKCIEVLHMWSKYFTPSPTHKYLERLAYGISMLQKFNTYMTH